MAAREAGYSQTTIDRKEEELKQRAANPGKTQRELRREQLRGPGLIQVREWSPVSGKVFTSFAPAVEKPEVKSKEKPAEKPFLPAVFSHPLLGEGRRSANGGFLPMWAADEFEGGSINTGSARMPGERPQSFWAKVREDQDRLARSYNTHRETPPPPPLVYHEEPEQLPARGFKDDGFDVVQEALEGRYGFARMAIKGG